MPAPASPISRSTIWALGATQIIGYGTSYYSFSIMAPFIGKDFGWPVEWVFGALSISLLIGGLVSPIAGQWADRFGGGRTMTLGTVATIITLAACGLAPEGFSFSLALITMEIATAFVLYNAAFALLVQVGGHRAQRSITHLTLIAGFASTLFWPFTALLVEHLSWREIYLLYAGFNLIVCLPLHYRLQRLRALPHGHLPDHQAAPGSGHLPPGRVKPVFILMTLGFSMCGFVVSALLVHMVPLMTTLGFGTMSVLVTSLFGPSQVLARFINMVFGKTLTATALAIIAASMLPLALALLAIPGLGIAGALGFAVVFGIASGLSSIVLGTLPLMLFGPLGYGRRLGWISAWRLVVSAMAPFVLSMLIAAITARVALGALFLVAAVGVAAFVMVARMARDDTPPPTITDPPPPIAA